MKQEVKSLLKCGIGNVLSGSLDSFSLKTVMIQLPIVKTFGRESSRV